MYCSECGKQFTSKDKFCSECGASILKNSPQNSVTLSGGVGVGGIIGHRNSIHVEKIENYNLDIKEFEITYQRKEIKPIPLTRKGISAFGKINTALGFLGSIASIVSIFGAHFDIQTIMDYRYFPMICGILFLLGMFSLLISVSLRKQGFFRMPIIWGRGVNLEEENGKLVITTIEGKCTICKGKVHLVSVENDTIGVCDNNPKHRFDFDHTTYKGKSI